MKYPSLTELAYLQLTILEGQRTFNDRGNLTPFWIGCLSVGIIHQQKNGGVDPAAFPSDSGSRYLAMECNNR